MAAQLKARREHGKGGRAKERREMKKKTFYLEQHVSYGHCTIAMACRSL